MAICLRRLESLYVWSLNFLMQIFKRMLISYRKHVISILAPTDFSPHFCYKYQIVMYFTVSMQGLDTLATQTMGMRESCVK